MFHRRRAAARRCRRMPPLKNRPHPGPPAPPLPPLPMSTALPPSPPLAPLAPVSPDPPLPPLPIGIPPGPAVVPGPGGSVGAVADERAPDQQLGGRIDDVRCKSCRRVCSGVLRWRPRCLHTARNRHSSELHKLLMKRRRLGASALDRPLRERRIVPATAADTLVRAGGQHVRGWG